MRSISRFLIVIITKLAVLFLPNQIPISLVGIYILLSFHHIFNAKFQNI